MDDRGRLPALLNVLSVTLSRELYRSGIHDDVAERHTDHVVIIYGADADALQVRQGHHQVFSSYAATVGVLPKVLQGQQVISFSHTCGRVN